MKTDFVLSNSVDEPVEAPGSGVSWPAVIAGAFVASALWFGFMALGAGIGLSALSPWPSSGLSPSRLAPGAILWIMVTQAAACSLGGYLAGRLRTRWVAVHTHEVYFRDTAHGFLVWAVGLVISVFFFSTLATAIGKEGVRVVGQHDYYSDTLFRTEHPTPLAGDDALRKETNEILAIAVAQPQILSADKAHLVNLVVARTGLGRAEAEARVNDVVRQDREALDKMRKATAHSLYWLFAALLLGAFCGSFAATVGGKQRDRVLKPIGRVPEKDHELVTPPATLGRRS